MSHLGKGTFFPEDLGFRDFEPQKQAPGREREA